MLKNAQTGTLGTGRVVYVRGTAYQHGRQIGEAAGDLIQENVDRATELCRTVGSGFDLDAYNSMTRRNERWVEHVYPELLQEIHGVADTSGIAYEDLLHLNLNTDVAYARAYAMVFDCTQVIATGSATIDGKTYIAKTRDLTRGPVRQLLVHREFEDGTYRNEIQTAGQMTLPVGVNSWGVSVGTSGQWSARVVVDLARGDAAWHIPNLQPILRYARSADEALDMVRAQPRVAGMNMTLADTSKAYALEITDRDVHVFEPEDGVLVRTNHYVSPALQHLAPTVEENRGTFDRYARAWEMATGWRGQIGAHDLVRLMSDHSEPPTESICRHGGSPGAGQTYAAMVICPQDRTVWAMFGNPCEGIQMVGRPGE
ncbi:MAG: acyl-CoA--6-aminopenicillanic acid acyl-transferase [Chloroflexota bacterium]